MASGDDEDQPQLKGVVIITLPPPDNPSLGKTITAFTISNSPPPSQNPVPSPPPSPINHARNSFRRTLFSHSTRRRRISRTVMGICLFAAILFCLSSSSPRALFKLTGSEVSNDGNDKDDKEKPRSFVFPLYPKLGFQEWGRKRDVEVKLGKFLKFNPKSSVLPIDDGGLPSMVKWESTAAVFPVTGHTFPDVLYYTQIHVGNPPRPYFLDIDTGSDLTWIQCDAPCTSCAKGAHPYYKPTKENIISPKDSFCSEVQDTTNTKYCETCNQCDYEIEYADHSTSLGVLSRDDLRLSDENVTAINPEVIIGCAYDQQGSLLNSLTKTDGILGLSKAKVSLPSQLARQGIIDNVIGHCLAADTRSGGYMFLGGDFVPHGKMTWIPMSNDASMYYWGEFGKITYGSKQLGLDGSRKGHGRIVFDSGSSYTYFTKQAYSDLVTMLKDVSREGLIQDTTDTTLPICWRPKSLIRSIKDVRKFFKPLTLQFMKKWWIISINLQIPPEGYLILSEKGNVCLGILDGSDLLDGLKIILGDISLHGNLIVYDNVNQKIGWMQSDCVKPGESNKLIPAF